MMINIKGISTVEISYVVMCVWSQIHVQRRIILVNPESVAVENIIF